MNRIPHPIPYQGSKRRLATAILEFIPPGTRRIVEPFCGSAALSLAALWTGRVEKAAINDAYPPLAALWQRIIDNPEGIAAGYERIWAAQSADGAADVYARTRAQFNTDGDPVKLLYLLARCVKAAVRFNGDGQFNQAPDRRRLGVRPETMRDNILGAAGIMRGRATVTCADYAAALETVAQGDVVYLDPPYQGTSGTRDQRYFRQLNLDRFIDDMAALRNRGIPVIISFDGRCGDRTYGRELPASLGLRRIEINAGRSSQATLSGRAETTVESLYVP